MIPFRITARFAAAVAMLLLASCANQKPAVTYTKDGKPVNPYPAGTYDHFKTEPTYPKTYLCGKTSRSSRKPMPETPPSSSVLRSNAAF